MDEKWKTIWKVILSAAVLVLFPVVSFLLFWGLMAFEEWLALPYSLPTVLGVVWLVVSLVLKFVLLGVALLICGLLLRAIWGDQDDRYLPNSYMRN